MSTSDLTTEYLCYIGNWRLQRNACGLDFPHDSSVGEVAAEGRRTAHAELWRVVGRRYETLGPLGSYSANGTLNPF